MEVYFENIKNQIIENLLYAKYSVKVISAYFTEVDLFNVLCELSISGIKIELIMADEAINTYQSNIEFIKLIESGGKVLITNRANVDTLIHHKFCVIDDLKVISGSFNWTKKASRNRENIFISEQQNIVKGYRQEFEFVKDSYCNPLTLNESQIESHFTELSNKVGSFKPNQLVCVSSESYSLIADFIVGLALGFANNMKTSIGLVSSDLSKDNLLVKIISLHSGIEYRKLRSSKLEDYEWKIFYDKSEEIKSFPIHILDYSATYSQLESRIKQLCSRGSKAVLIDQIDRIFPTRDSDGNGMREIMSKLKNLTRQLRTPIFIASEKVNMRGRKEHEIDILYDYSDILLFLEKDIDIFEDLDNELDQVVVKILKNNSGGVGNVYLSYNERNGQLSNQSGAQENFSVYNSSIFKDNEDYDERDIPF